MALWADGVVLMLMMMGLWAGFYKRAGLGLGCLERAYASVLTGTGCIIAGVMRLWMSAQARCRHMR